MKRWQQVALLVALLFLLQGSVMKLKAGVVLELTPKMQDGLERAARVFAQVTGRELTVTSGSDGTHMHGSKHYTGEAVDIRTRDITTAQKYAVADALRMELGNAFDVVIESDHIHIEVR